MKTGKGHNKLAAKAIYADSNQVTGEVFVPVFEHKLNKTPYSNKQILAPIKAYG